ncbi:MAG: hypothetical protein AB2A00_21170 [Myxococcota bacterium]
MLDRLKNWSLIALLGAVAGVVVTTLIAPGILGWYHTPGAGGALCNCQELAESTASQLIKLQLGGAGTGALTFLVLGALIHRARRNKTPALPPAATPPAPPAGTPS